MAVLNCVTDACVGNVLHKITFILAYISANSSNYVLRFTDLIIVSAIVNSITLITCTLQTVCHTLDFSD